MSTLFTPKVQATLAAAVLLVSGMTATTQAQIHRQVRVQIPFAFEQGSKHFAAGQYTLFLESDHLLLVRGDKDGGLSLANLDVSMRPADKGKIVFQRYGNRYFLHQVWMAGETTHIECPRSREEKSLQREIQLASVENMPAKAEYAMVEVPR